MGSYLGNGIMETIAEICVVLYSSCYLQNDFLKSLRWNLMKTFSLTEVLGQGHTAVS